MTSKEKRIAALRRIQAIPVTGPNVASNEDLEKIIKAIEAEEDEE